MALAHSRRTQELPAVGTTSAPLFAAVCLAGQLRLPKFSKGGSAPRGAPGGDYMYSFTAEQAKVHWMAQRSFVKSLMLGTHWNGLHAILTTDSSQMNETLSLIKSTWDLPSSNLHAVWHNRSADEVISARCGEDAYLALLAGTEKRVRCTSCVNSALSNLRSFYGQWDKAAACFSRVLRIEMEHGTQRFQHVVKMRPDWAFRRGPTLTSLADTSTLYCRFRCAETKPRFLPPLYLSYTLHRDYNVIHRNSGACPPGTLLFDDQFVIAPRRLASALFSASSLQCPFTDPRVSKAVEDDCKGYLIQECMLTVHLGGLHASPIPIHWGVWRYESEDSTGWSGYAG